MKIVNPLVSIIIPVFNGSNFLNQAIDSALFQTYSNCEIIVVNDGSSDSGLTRNIALSYGEKIRYFEKANGGVSSALNLGIKQMAGDYFSWLSHDDVYFPNKIQNQVKFCLENNYEVIYSDYIFINDTGSLINCLSPVKENFEKELNYQLLIGYPIHGCAMLIKKTILDHVGPFDEDLKYTQDYDYWFRILKQYKIHFLDEVLLKCRLHELQDSNLKPERHFECDELYVKMVRYFVFKLSKNDELFLNSFKSLVGRGYYSAAVMSFKYYGGKIEKLKNAFWFFYYYFSSVVKNKITNFVN